MIWRSNRPLMDALTGHWVSMTGTALVTLAGFSWLFLLPMHVSGHADNPYIGLFAFVVLPLIFFTGLMLIPIGAALRTPARGPWYGRCDDRRQVWRRAGIFFAVMTLANLVIGSQLSYRAVAHMETVQFCGQTCHVMKPEFTAHLRAPHASVDCVACHVGRRVGFDQGQDGGHAAAMAVMLNNYPRPIESAMESNRLVSSAETCEKCHQREKPMKPSLRVITKYKDDETNTPQDGTHDDGGSRIQAAHLRRAWKYATRPRDKKRQTIPWVEYRVPSGSPEPIWRATQNPSIAALPKFTMQCVDCHNRAAHSFEVADRAIDGAMLRGEIPAICRFQEDRP